MGRSILQVNGTEGVNGSATDLVGGSEEAKGLGLLVGNVRDLVGGL